jgi:hypothetical protein
VVPDARDATSVTKNQEKVKYVCFVKTTHYEFLFGVRLPGGQAMADQV